jgi:hypothetical protein
MKKFCWQADLMPDRSLEDLQCEVFEPEMFDNHLGFRIIGPHACRP